ncbi:hypothetical protein QF035_000310 [Streptomyces umbrinus]|uniref:Uncharacterized protein n=1 Tax=Streptomyces umbrinus TaxID=67370 RepID=A0ABU0SGN2_9ACTN|nr:hypothetical protein [Streptomyces umbrinus]MDQ1022728.1 hypothetical protein [Streptomyces umbrinus]
MRAVLKYDGSCDAAMAESTPTMEVRAPAASAAPARATLILAIICVSYFMVIFDNSIVFTGLPQIRSAMGFSGHEAADIAARSGAALTGTAVLLALALAATRTLIVPTRTDPQQGSLYGRARTRLPAHRHHRRVRQRREAGQAIRTSAVPRDDLFIETKIWISDWNPGSGHSPGSHGGGGPCLGFGSVGSGHGLHWGR